MLPTLAQLVQVVTASNAYQSILSIANTLGLQTSAWAPLGMARTIMSTMSQVVASASSYVNLIAQGGYATTAAAMTDANGNPITTWMDLVSAEQYGNTRNPAVAASGVIGLANAQSVPYGIEIGALHFKNPAGATFSNSAFAEIFGNAGSSIPFNSFIAVVADVPGLGTTANGQYLSLTTPLAGVTVLPLGFPGSSTSLVGTPAESNQALLSRDILKLGSISPNGAAFGLVYIAETPAIIALFGVVSAPITRAQESFDPLAGIVYLYIANSGGAATTPDAAIVQAAEQALATPTGLTLSVLPATNVFIVVQAIIYVIGQAGSIANQAQTNVQLYFSLLPIGGTNGSVLGEVPRTGITASIQAAAQLAITEIDYISPLVNTVLSPGQVPVLDPTSYFIVVVVPFP